MEFWALPPFFGWFVLTLDFLEQNHNERAEKFVAKGKSNIKFLFQCWVGVFDSFMFWQDISSKPAENVSSLVWEKDTRNQWQKTQETKKKKKERGNCFF